MLRDIRVLVLSSMVFVERFILICFIWNGIFFFLLELDFFFIVFWCLRLVRIVLVYFIESWFFKLMIFVRCIRLIWLEDLMY